MTHVELLMLYQLKGTLEGQRTVLKCSVAAAAKTRDVARTDWLVASMAGRVAQGVKALRMVQCLIRLVDQIIKGAERKELEK